MPFFDFDDHFLQVGQMEWANLNKGATKVGHSQCHILSQAKIPFGNPNLPRADLVWWMLSPFFSPLLQKTHGKTPGHIADIAARHLGASRQDLNGSVDLLIAPHQGIHHAIGRSLPWLGDPLRKEW